MPILLINAHFFLQSIDILKRTAENIKDPLFRFFEREVTSGSRLLRDVRSDLTDIISVCEARKKQTNYLRSVISDLTKGMVSSVLRLVCTRVVLV